VVGGGGVFFFFFEERASLNTYGKGKGFRRVKKGAKVRGERVRKGKNVLVPVGGKKTGVRRREFAEGGRM